MILLAEEEGFFLGLPKSPARVYLIRSQLKIRLINYGPHRTYAIFAYANMRPISPSGTQGKHATCHEILTVHHLVRKIRALLII